MDMRLKKTIAAIAATVAAFAIPVVTEGQAEASITTGHIWAYTDANYGYPLIQTKTLVAGLDCQPYIQDDLTMWLVYTWPTSSANFDPGGRIYCNAMQVDGPRLWNLHPTPPAIFHYTQCISHNNSGIPLFGGGTNDDAEAVYMYYSTSCGTY